MSLFMGVWWRREREAVAVYDVNPLGSVDQQGGLKEMKRGVDGLDLLV